MTTRAWISQLCEKLTVMSQAGKVTYMSAHILEVQVHHFQRLARFAGYTAAALFAAVIAICAVFAIVPEAQGHLLYAVNQNTCEAYNVTPDTKTLMDLVLPPGYGWGAGYHQLPDSDPSGGRWTKPSVRIHYSFNVQVSKNGRSSEVWRGEPILILKRPANCPQ